jgi:hypothetical protein
MGKLHFVRAHYKKAAIGRNHPRICLNPQNNYTFFVPLGDIWRVAMKIMIVVTFRQERLVIRQLGIFEHPLGILKYNMFNDIVLNIIYLIRYFCFLLEQGTKHSYRKEIISA